MADAVSENTLEKTLQPEFKNFCLIILAIDIIFILCWHFLYPCEIKKSLRKI